MNTGSEYPVWIEATWMDPCGTLFAWYHRERIGICGAGNYLDIPEIGALVSDDGGFTFRDLGVVLSSGDALNCSAQNGYFAGGHGDFSVILSADGKYFYFLFGNYGGPEERQGVAAARMAFEDRAAPAGAVWKYADGEWNEPGNGGRVTPFLPVAAGWSRPDPDAFWGPSVHWNTHIGAYVILLNRASGFPGWTQEGIYASFSKDISNPHAWSAPVKILAGGAWYPQVLGLNAGETDKSAGQVSRLDVCGTSEWELVFTEPLP